MKKLDWKWLGGFFDGEGSISISKRRYNGKRDGFELCISMGQTKKHAGILDLLSAKFGGGVVDKQQTPKDAVVTHWSVKHKKAEVFLRKLYTYLKIKKPRADIALEYRKLVSKSHSGIGGCKVGHMMPQSTWNKMNRLYLKLRALNKKGPNGK